MEITKTYEGLKASLGIGISLVLIFLILCLVPALFLWVVNSLFEAGGSAFYIEHGLFNYFLAFLFLCLVRGNGS